MKPIIMVALSAAQDFLTAVICAKNAQLNIRLISDLQAWPHRFAVLPAERRASPDIWPPRDRSPYEANLS
jgi:hypothetical protein